MLLITPAVLDSEPITLIRKCKWGLCKWPICFCAHKTDWNSRTFSHKIRSFTSAFPAAALVWSAPAWPVLHDAAGGAGDDHWHRTYEQSGRTITTITAAVIVTVATTVAASKNAKTHLKWVVCVKSALVQVSSSRLVGVSAPEPEHGGGVPHFVPLTKAGATHKERKNLIDILPASSSSSYVLQLATPFNLHWLTHLFARAIVLFWVCGSVSILSPAATTTDDWLWRQWYM